jgi:C_GCAxxG_C_C family probable redox protein
LLAVGEHKLGHLESQSIRMSNAFAGGVAGTHQEMCGAQSGGLMVIGGLYGRVRADTPDERAREVARAYRDVFVVEFGHTQCEPIRKSFAKPDGSHGCDKVVERAARALLNVLEAYRPPST